MKESSMDPVRGEQGLPLVLQASDVRNVGSMASEKKVGNTFNGVEIFRTSSILAIISFILHFTWEYFHFGLYAGYDHWTGNVPVYWIATVGDALYTVGAFALVSAIKKSYEWIKDATLADFLMLVTLGCLLALFVEYKGLALDRWEYLPEMPLIPFLGVGLSPILQMAILLPASFAVTQWVSKWFRQAS